MRKGCLDDPSSPICQLNNENGARISGCCNDTDMCNVNLLQIGEYINEHTRNVSCILIVAMYSYINVNISCYRLSLSAIVSIYILTIDRT